MRKNPTHFLFSSDTSHLEITDNVEDNDDSGNADMAAIPDAQQRFLISHRWITRFYELEHNLFS